MILINEELLKDVMVEMVEESVEFSEAYDYAQKVIDEMVNDGCVIRANATILESSTPPTQSTNPTTETPPR